MKTIFDAEVGELLGAHMVGAEVIELIQGYVVARQLETTEADLRCTVFPHPTLSERMHESVLDAYGRRCTTEKLRREGEGQQRAATGNVGFSGDKAWRNLWQYL